MVYVLMMLLEIYYWSSKPCVHMKTHYLCKYTQIYTYANVHICPCLLLVFVKISFLLDFFYFLFENFLDVWIIFQSFPFLSSLIIVYHFSPSIDICFAQIFWDVGPSSRAWLTYSGLQF